MTTSHTPGPWFINRDQDSAWTAPEKLSIEGGGLFIAEVDHCSRQEGNANLIISAPDLLEALEALVEYVDEMHRIGHIQRPVQSSNAVAAIAKARGGK